MRQKQIGKNLYVLTTEPYVISDVGDASVIFVHTNYYDDFKVLNPSLELTRYNYLLLRKGEPEYYQYIDAKEEVDFDFLDKIINTSSFVDETKTMYIQQLSVPDDFDGIITYYLDDVELDSSVFTITNASSYIVSAITSDSSIYVDDTSSFYTINYEKFKRTASISFANATVEVSTYKDENYTGTIQTLQGVPSGVTAKYYLDSSLLSSNNITISSEGNHVVKGSIENHPVYNDVSTSYTISYSKVKRDAVLSFANATDSSNVEAGGTFTTTVQNVTGAPQGVSLKYYLNNSLLSDNTITINDVSEGTTSYTVSVKIENDSIYNDTSANYTLQIVGQKPSYQKYECFIKQSANADYVLFNLGYSSQFTQVFDDKYEFNNSIVSASALNGHGKALPGSSFNTLVFKLKDSTTSTIMTRQNGWSYDLYLPSKQFTDVIDIPENVRTMISWDSKNNSTINKLIIRSPYLYTGNAPGNVSSNIKIYVPEDSLQNYKTSNKWRSVSTYLYGSDFSKDFLTIRFLEDTIDVSTMTGQNYNGTLQNYYGIPNGVPVKFYLDSSLLNSSSYTLTTAGTHTILAEISNNSSYYDTSTVYTINYTQVAPPEPEQQLYWFGFICDQGMEGWSEQVYGVRVPTDTQIIDQTQDQYVEFSPQYVGFSPYRIFYEASTGYFYKQTLVNGSVDSAEQLVAEDGYYTTMFGGSGVYSWTGTSYEALEEEDWNDDGEINMERRAPFTFYAALDYDPNEGYEEEEPEE